jgi:hypothetical protein
MFIKDPHKKHLAVQNVFGAHRLVAAQKARISALKAAGLATKGQRAATQNHGTKTAALRRG